MSYHCFPRLFAPCCGHSCHQEQKEAAFIDNCRCGRHRLIALVGYESITTQKSFFCSTSRKKEAGHNSRLLLNRISAINDKIVTGDEGGAGRAEEENGVRDLFRPSEPTHGMEVGVIFAFLAFF